MCDGVILVLEAHAITGRWRKMKETLHAAKCTCTGSNFSGRTFPILRVFIEGCNCWRARTVRLGFTTFIKQIAETFSPVLGGERVLISIGVSKSVFGKTFLSAGTGGWWPRQVRTRKNSRNVLIVGAGKSGRGLAATLTSASRVWPRCTRICGRTAAGRDDVHGRVCDLARVIRTSS